MGQKFSLDGFKEALRTDIDLKSSLAGTSDTFDFDNGNAIIHRENINRYLEKYMCKSEQDLEDTLWYSYGVYVKIV
jgi:hypothetical protein